MVCLLGAGILLGLTFPGFVPWSSPLISLLAWLALIPWFYIIGRTDNPRQDFDRSQAFSLGIQALLASWVLSLVPQQDPSSFPLASCFLVGLGWLGMSLFYSLPLAFGGLAYGALVRRYVKAGGPAWALPLMAGSYWAVFEWAGTLGPLAYPWGTLAVTQTANLALLQTLPLGGPYLLGGLMAAFACGIAEGVRTWRTRRRISPLVLIAVLMVMGLWTLGHWRMGPTPSGGIRVAAIQGNYDRREKWNPAMLHHMASRYLDLSASAPEAQLVVWPETPLPVYWNHPSPEAEKEISRFRAAFQAPGRYLVTGGFFRFDSPDPAAGSSWIAYNAATILGPDRHGWQLEAKRHLAPLGEFIPFRAIAPGILANFNLLGHDLTPGRAGYPLVTPVATIGVGICFDAYFPRALADDTRAGATVLGVLANDDWLSKTFAPHLSLANATLRAVENRRFLIRIGNTGITALMDPYGRVLQKAPPFQPAVLEGNVVPMQDLTPYTRWGDWPVAIGALILVGSALFTFSGATSLRGTAS